MNGRTHDTGRTDTASLPPLARDLRGRLPLLWVSLIVVAAWATFALQYGLMGRWQTVAIDVAVALGSLLVHLAARLVTGRRAVAMLGNLLLGLSLAGLVAAGVTSGQARSMAPWFLVLAPLVAGYLIGPRATWGWAAAAAVAISLVHLSEQLAFVEPEFVPAGIEVLGGQLVLLGVATAFGLAAVQAIRAGVDRVLEEMERTNAANEASHAANARLRVLVQSLVAGVAVTDEHGRLVVVNRALLRAFGSKVSPEEAEGELAFEIIGRHSDALEDYASYRHRVLELARLGEPVYGEEVRFAEGRVYERDFVPIVLEGGLRGHVWTYRDVTRRKEEEARVRERAETDALTGLRNRTTFFELLAVATGPAVPYGRRFAVLFVDLDGFKEVNDTHGHRAGDEVLREVATRISLSVREFDVVARLGGDEFVVLLAGVSLERARVPAQKILASLERPFRVESAEVSLGASIGVALYPETATEPEALVRAADEAMYQVKRSGKGDVGVATRLLA